MYGSSYMFRKYIAIFRERSYCLLRDSQLMSSRKNTVDERVVSSDVVRAHAHSQNSIDCSSIEHLSEGTRNAP
jgi:hypothetical protein